MNMVRVYEHDVMCYRYKQDDDILIFQDFMWVLWESPTPN